MTTQDEQIKQEKQNIEEAEKQLGQPTFIEFSDETLRVRRNLMLMGSISMFFAFGNGIFDGNITLIGVKVSQFSQTGLYTSLLAMTFYHASHFVWQSWDTYLEWKNRLTGTFNFRPSYGGIAGIDHRDIPAIERNSSLYVWWLQEKKLVDEGYENTAKLMSNIGNNKTIPKTTYINLLSNEEFKLVRDHLSNLERILESPRMAASLDRFDRNFRMYQISQILRFALLEFGFPFVLSFFAIGGLIRKIFS